MLVVGISGVTNGGKTTVAEALHEALPRSHLLCQDTYFWPKESGRHVLVPEVNHFNWEIMSSLDMDTMQKDIDGILKNVHSDKKSLSNNSSLMEKQGSKELNIIKDIATKNIADIQVLNNVDILIIEGFLVLNYKPIIEVCDLKYHLTLTKEECLKRRSARVYDPPDVPKYFELCVWPEYVKHKEEMMQTVKDVKVINGTRDIASILNEILKDICEKAKNLN